MTFDPSRSTSEYRRSNATHLHLPNPTMHVDRRNTRADHFRVSDVDLRGDGTPIMISLPGGTVVSKDIEYTTTMCPECEDDDGEHTTAAWTDELGDEICPECGMICNGHRKQMWPEDFNFGSRGGFEDSGFPALNDSAPRHSTATPMDSAQLYSDGETHEA